MYAHRLHRRAVGATMAAAMTAATLTAVAPGAAAAPARTPGTKSVGPFSQKQSTGDVSLRSSASTGVVETTPQVYLVFWGSQWSNDSASAATALQDLFSNLHGSADTWGTILDQYCEGLPTGTVTCGSAGTHIQHPSSSVLQGVWFDNGSPAPNKATNGQIAAEAVSAAAHFQNTTQAPNLNAQYVIASPSGTHPGGFPKGFCAWHNSTTSSFGSLSYTNLPYVPDLGAGACTTIQGARLIDGYESTETHEYAESVTDPFPSSGWLKGGAEIGDLCVNEDAYLTINGLAFDVQGLWSNVAEGCVTHG